MNVVIVEDELTASENLAYLLHYLDRDIKILQVLDSVKTAVNYFSKPNAAELVFMDIHLADGISFEIFERVNIGIPVVFTTAFDQYTMKAFKVNSIDYLLKPVDEDELSGALVQFREQTQHSQITKGHWDGLLEMINGPTNAYRETFLVHLRDEMVPIKSMDIAYFQIDLGFVKAVTMGNRYHRLDGNLEDIEGSLDPAHFFRANRQFIVQKSVITKIKHYFNGKLIVEIEPEPDERIVVSKAKAKDFKNWIVS